MLVLTRREGEEVIIGDPKNPIGIVRLVSIKGERARIGFDKFDSSIPIHRKEIAGGNRSIDAQKDNGHVSESDVVGQ